MKQKERKYQILGVQIIGNVVMGALSQMVFLMVFCLACLMIILYVYL